VTSRYTSHTLSLKTPTIKHKGDYSSTCSKHKENRTCSRLKEGRTYSRLKEGRTYSRLKEGRTYSSQGTELEGYTAAAWNDTRQPKYPQLKRRRLAETIFSKYKEQLPQKNQEAADHSKTQGLLPQNYKEAAGWR
jgi:hypothetical protein